MLKKFLALFLTFATTLLLFVGCSGGEQSNDSKSVNDVTDSQVSEGIDNIDDTQSDVIGENESSQPTDSYPDEIDPNESKLESSTDSTVPSKPSDTNPKPSETVSNPGSSTSKPSSSTQTPSTPTTSKPQTPKITEKVLTVPKLAVNIATTKKTEVITYNGSIDSVNDKDEYTYIAKETGRVRFEINELKSGIILKLYIYDRLDNVVDSDGYCTNNQGVTFKVEKGQTYKVVVSCYNNYGQTKFGSYELNIWQPKAEINVNNYSMVKDSIEFVDQRNIYKFTAPIDGTYKFYMTEMKSGAYVGIYIYNYLDELVYDSDYAYNNGNAIVAKFKAGETYEIQVRYSSQSDYVLTSYTLNIGKQKETKEISSYNKVKDSIEYVDQKNNYIFTVPKNGSYTFKMTEMMSNQVNKVYIYNYLDEAVCEDSVCVNNDELALKNVKKGEKYRIVVTSGNQYSSSKSDIGAYCLVIK